ncbi:polyketide synthase [bacterium]|nr:MAG: polyketide synthase [bacterium]
MTFDSARASAPGAPAGAVADVAAGAAPATDGGLSPLKQAIVELRTLRAERDALRGARHAPIAVIGMACRFPGGADDPAAFWRLLDAGVDAITEIPTDRWDVDAHFDPDPDAPGKHSTRWGGFVSGIEAFDPAFFGITPREAVSMDPQQRLVLEVGWEALEHAGQSPERLAGRAAGVFVGIGTQDYAHLRLMSGAREGIDAYLATGTCHSIASGRLSYALGLTGPSVSVDTACSSSLVAIHLAVQSLRAGECRMALAGGVNAILMPEMVVTLAKAHMLAADGRCKTFDARADGFVRGEGCGMVILKRLDDAIDDRDRILAVIRGTAVNQDGRSNGLTAPNGPAQVAVIRAALADAGVEPATVDFVETHGTGTALGDPIEVEALGEAYGRDRPDDRPLLLGSVKTNIGHLEAAAGVAGLIKAVLALRHGAIPPHLHLRVPNPLIDWQRAPVQVPTNRTPWPENGWPRRAGVSSFGFSGTNAHVVLEAAPAWADASPIDVAPVDGRDPMGNRSRHIVCLSARTRPALAASAERLVEHLRAHPDADVAAVAFTANAGRSHFEHRLAVIVGDDVGVRSTAPGTDGRDPHGTTAWVADSPVQGGSGSGIADLAAKLVVWRGGGDPAGVFHGRAAPEGRPPVAFLFTGQGAQYTGMGRGLYATEPVFRGVVDACTDVAALLLDRPLRDVLWAADGDGAALDRTAYTQPALFALQAALAALWRSWGIEPAAVLGHSVGELAAAHVAGVMGLEDGLRLAAARGRLMQSLAADGAMAVAFADVGRVAPFVADHPGAAAIAAVNGPDNTVVAGRVPAVAAIVDALGRAGIKARPLKVALPAHSPLVDPILDAFTAVAAGVRFHAPTVTFISGVTGAVESEAVVADPAYWRRNLREPVRYAAAVATLAGEGCRACVEIGPGSTLAGMGRRAWPAGFTAGVWLPSLRSDRPDEAQMLDSLAQLYTNGAAVDWVAFERGRPRPITLPTYPWQREAYWLPEVRAAQQASDRSAAPSASSLWRAAVGAGARQAAQAPLDLDLPGHADRWAALDALAIAHIAATLRGWGVFDSPGAVVTVDGLLTEHGLQAGHRRLLTRWLRRLAAEGWLEGLAGDAYRPVPPAIWPDVAERYAAARARFTDGPLLPDYAQRCGEALARVLAGRCDPLELLFPGGRLDTADYLYRGCDVPRYCNAVARAAVEAVAHAWPPGRRLRVIDVGAGTGGLAADLLPALPAQRTDYAFTDVSEFFFARAAERFSGYPFIRFGRLDIERPPAEQGFGRYAFDVVVAANVLHATRNIDTTLAHVRSLLVPGGLLVVFETTQHPAWFDTTIALIDGWSRHQDDDRRRDHPLLTADAWLAALGRAGFAPAAAWPDAASPAAVLGGHVLVAQAPATAEAGAGPARGWLSTPAIAADKGVGPALEGAGVALGGGGVASSSGGDAAMADGRRGVESPMDAWRTRWPDAPPRERRAWLVGFVRDHVVRVARCDPSRPPDRRQRLSDLGLDSLMAVELRDRLAAGLRLDAPLPATLMFDYPTIDAIAGHLDARLAADAAAAPDDGAAASAATAGGDPSAAHPARGALGAPDAAAATSTIAGRDLADLSDAEVEVLLAERLRTLAAGEPAENGAA